jgi:ferrous iron transport protein B
MELPAYHMPRPIDLLRSMWERGWSFIKKAATIILLSTVILWFFTFFGFTESGFRMLAEDELSKSLLAGIGSTFAWVFAPLGFGNWQAAVATVTGLIAKENIVGTLTILYGDNAGIGAAFTVASGYAFLVFNLLCAPCFAAIGAMNAELKSKKWLFAGIGLQLGVGCSIGFVTYFFGTLISGEAFLHIWMPILGWAILLAFALTLTVLIVKRDREIARSSKNSSKETVRV